MITREKVKRLERALDEIYGGGLVIPIMATPAEAEAIRQEAKRQGRKTIGTPIQSFIKDKPL